MRIDRSKKVFIDSNMLMFAADFKQDNVFDWMDQLYEEIYIHKEVLNELLLSDVREKVNTYLSRVVGIYLIQQTS